MELDAALAGGLLAVFLGSTVQATAGLGYSLVAVPIAILFFPPQVAIPALLILGAVVNAIALFETRRSVELGRFVPFALFAAAVTPVGAYLLTRVDVGQFKVGVGIAIVVIGAALLFGFQWRPKRRWVAVPVVGTASGLLQGGLAMGAPPMVVFLSGQRVDKRVFRATMFAYLTVINIAALVSYAVGGLLTTTVLWKSLWLSPAMAVGSLAGVLLAKRLPEATFRRVALVLVIAGGVTSVVSGWGA